MWDVYLRRWMDLLFWWVPRKEQGKEAERTPRKRTAEPAARSAEPSRPPAAEQAARPKAAARKAAEPRARAESEANKPVAAPVPDDLTEIKGIGPAMQNKLRALGITTFADLAAADPDQLMARLKGTQPLSLGRVRHWIEVAKQRART